MALAKSAVTHSSLPDGLGVRRNWVNMSSNHLSMLLILSSGKDTNNYRIFGMGMEKKSDFCEKRVSGRGKLVGNVYICSMNGAWVVCGMTTIC